MFAYINTLVLFLQFVSAHFIISYPDNISLNKIENIADYMENKYSILSETWKLERKDKIIVIFYSSTYDFLKFSHSVPGLGAKYSDGKIHLQPITLLERKKILYQVLAHELAHAFLEEYSEKGFPIWFNESFAIYFSGELNKYKPQKKIRLDHFEDLNTYLKTKDLKIQNTVYFYLGITMQFFIDTYTQDKIERFIKSFETGNNNHYVRAFNESKDSVEQKWKNSFGHYKVMVYNKKGLSKAKE